MNGITKWGLISAMAAVCYSCGSDDLYDPEKADELKLAKYEKAFVAKYGAIAPDQDWGFGEAEVGAKAVTRECKTGNGISYYVAREDLPLLVTDDEKDPNKDVVKAFRENLGVNIPVESLNWTDFFVQQVYTGHHKYDYFENRNKTTQSVADASNQMCNLKSNGEHVHSSNNGELARPEDVIYNDGTADKEVVESDFVLMINSLTRFTYLNTTDSKEHNKYVVKKINDAYYIGFDYTLDKGEDGIMEGDNKYDDWIIKVTPAKFKGTRRIMAEDLALTTGDFDFNDVVFDAAKVGNEYVITLHAAGGMLPLYIGDKEVHELFGVSTTTMVNTQPGKHTEKAPVVFRLEGEYNDVKEIPITVKGKELILLRAEIGEAPSKLCGPTTCEWTDETYGIDKLYKNFREKVQASGNWWE